jgi:hypothetical protein
MKLQNQGQIQEVTEAQALKLKRRGWVEVKEQVGEEVIRLKPAVKSKATVTALEAANIKNKGDE